MITSKGVFPHLRAPRGRGGEEELEGFSLKEGAWSSEAECDGATKSTALFLLKMRPVQISSSSEAVWYPQD